MIHPTEKDIGRGVIYRADSKLLGEREAGVITGFNDRCVFVRYGGCRNSAATSREDLTWEFPQPPVSPQAQTIGDQS